MGVIYMQSSNLTKLSETFFLNFVNKDHGEVGPLQKMTEITKYAMHNFIHSCSDVTTSWFGQ